jgi:AdoMet-dependent heme synthase
MALDVYLTNACNLRCKFCFNLDDFSAPQIPLDDVCQILKAAYGQGHRYVSITGGEPFIYKRIFDVFDFAHELGMWINVLSHGGLLTDEKIRRLKPYWRLRIRISLDGANKETHDALRGQGTFDTTLTKIERLIDAGIPVGVGMTVSQQNVGEIPEMMSLCVAKGVGFLRMIPVVRVKKGKAATVDAALHERILESIIEESIKYIDLLDLPPRSERSVLNDINLLTTRRCMAGSQFFSITSNKEVLPCPLIYEHPKIPTRKFESVETFKEITKSMDEIFESMQPNLKGICQSCEFRTVCYGGCVAEKLSFDRDIADEQPVCTKKILERVGGRFAPEQLQMLMNSWVDRLTQSLEYDDKHACMRQAPYWSVNFRSRNAWNGAGARFH